MPVHDWTLVEAGIFHDFHTAWIPELRKALNRGILPDGYYALAEQHVGGSIADVLTLHGDRLEDGSNGGSNGRGLAVAEAPPRVRYRKTIEPVALLRRRSLAVRHVSGHRLVALVEILSPANKDRTERVDEFVSKVVSALDAGVHVLVVDLCPPGPRDPHGIHELIMQSLSDSEETYELPKDEPLTLASYEASAQIDAHVEYCAVGAELPDMPLFYQPGRYVNVPLPSTYSSAYAGMPAFWRNVLEGK